MTCQASHLGPRLQIQCLPALPKCIPVLLDSTPESFVACEALPDQARGLSNLTFPLRENPLLLHHSELNPTSGPWTRCSSAWKVLPLSSMPPVQRDPPCPPKTRYVFCVPHSLPAMSHTSVPVHRPCLPRGAGASLPCSSLWPSTWLGVAAVRWVCDLWLWGRRRGKVGGGRDVVGWGPQE